MTAALGPFIMRHPDVKGNMEQFVLQHVIPEFSAPEPSMRAVACEVLGTMIKAGLKFSQEQHLHTAFTAVAQCIDDAELPVRVHACLALTEMVTDSETGMSASCAVSHWLLISSSQTRGCASGRQSHPK